MSHIVSIKTEIRDEAALSAACRRLRLNEPEIETVDLFQEQATGHAVRLRDWRYPVVCDLPTGQIYYDNFGGRWGKQQELDSLLQSYAIEKTRIESNRAGYTVTEHELQDGSVKLTIDIGGSL